MDALIYLIDLLQPLNKIMPELSKIAFSLICFSGLYLIVRAIQKHSPVSRTQKEQLDKLTNRSAMHKTFVSAELKKHDKLSAYDAKRILERGSILYVESDTDFIDLYDVLRGYGLRGALEPSAGQVNALFDLLPANVLAGAKVSGYKDVKVHEQLCEFIRSNEPCIIKTLKEAR